MAASQNGHIEVVKILVVHCANLNAQDLVSLNHLAKIKVN